MRRFALVLVLLLVGAPLLLSPAMASPQPTPVCRFCGGQFSSAAQEAGVNVTVASSAVDVYVEPDGSARWTIRLDLSNGSAALVASPDRLETAARSLTDDGYGLPEDPIYRDDQIEGSQVALRYHAADAAERHAGVLVVDLLHDGGRESWYHVNAERFTIHGPEETVVVNTPESGRVDGRSVTWRGQSGESWYDGTDLHGSPNVAFAPPGGELRGSVAIGLATLPIVVMAIQHFLLVQTLLFGVMLGLVVLGVSRFRPDPPIGPLVAGIGLLGALGIGGMVFMNGPEWQSAPPILALGLAAIAWTPTGRRWLHNPRSQAIAVAGLLVVSYGLLLAIHATLADQWTRPTAIALRATALGFPLGAMVPLGGALVSEEVDLRRWFGLSIVAFVAVPSSMVNLFDPPSGLGAGFFMIGLGAVALAAPVAGSLGLVLGRSLAVEVAESVD